MSNLIIRPDHARLAAEIERRKRAQDLADEASGSFKRFMELSWHVVEPAKAFIPNWHMDAICLPADAVIETEFGPMKIGDMRDYSGCVLSWNHERQVPEWRRMTRWMCSPGKSLLRITLESGKTLELTDNHPIYLEERGYVNASAVKAGETAITVPTLRQRLLSATDTAGRDILQHGLLQRRQGRAANLRGLRGDDHTADGALPDLLGEITPHREKASLPAVRQDRLSLKRKTGRIVKNLRVLLQQALFRAVRYRREEPSLLQWPLCRSIPGVVCNGQEESSGTRGLGLFYMPDAGDRESLPQGGGRTSADPRHPSHRSEHKEQSAGQSRCSVSEMPQATGVFRSRREVIRSIEGPLPAPGLVYNLEVEEHHNYFANGVLVHNCDHFQAIGDGTLRKLLVTVPPGSAKSIIAAVQFPAWMWVPKRNPGWRSTFASYGSTLADRDSVRCRDLLKSIWYRETFNPEWRFSSSQDVKSYFVNTAKGHRFATSVGATATGFRGDFIGVDDAMKASDRNSDAAIMAMIDWWVNEMYNRLNDLSTGARAIIMQRLADRDLAGHVLREGGYEHLCIPMEYDPNRSRATSIGWNDPRSEKGELMFPQLFPPEVVVELKADEARWASQYQQNPTGEGGGLLKPHLWNYWQPPGSHLPAVRVKMPDGSIDERRAVELPEAFDFELSSWDCTFKDLKDSDYVVGMGIAVRGANRYIRPDCTRARLDLPGTIAAVRSMSGRYPRTFTKLIEDKANGSAVIQMLRDEISGLLAVNPRDGKVARANAASPSLKSGNWFLPHPLLAPWVGNPENPTESGFLAESVSFPFGPNDDYVDAWSQAAIWIQTEGIGRVFATSEMDIRVDRIEIGVKWPRMFGLSITPFEVGAVWMARKPETGQHYLYAEYSAPASDPAKHVEQLVKPGVWFPGVMHNAGVGRDQRDGRALAEKYRGLGLKGLDTANDNVRAEIAGLQEAFSSGKLKVMGDLNRFFDQYRTFRADDNGKLPHYNAGVIMAAAVAWRHKDRMRPPVEPTTVKQQVAGTQGNGWMGV